MKIAIIGNGFVGQATSIFFKNNPAIEGIIYDIVPEKCSPIGTTLDDVVNCQMIFLCIPTPIDCCNNTHTEWLDSSILKIKLHPQYEKLRPIIVVRSTVPVGFSSGHDCCMMPEFLTEKNWKQDFYNTNQWVFGTPSSFSPERTEHARNIFSTIIKSAKECDAIANDNTLFVESKEAEMIKYGRNCFLALKISYFNELYDFAQSHNMNFENITRGIGADHRIGMSHTLVPGYDGHRGYGGTCLPKDTISLVTQFSKQKVPCYILRASMDRNNLQDRVDQDWKSDVGRTFVHKK